MNNNNSFDIERMSDDIREIKKSVAECSNEGNSMYILLRDRIDDLQISQMKIVELLTEINNKLPAQLTFPKGVGLTQEELEGSETEAFHFKSE